ncbi:hypothetical protein ACFQ78_38695 [Streptomyces sp. NPDC056519]|uniref:hypothetical protein n=1 Tax=Streptomyces sp. NPDC056519 TaxID=3345849 RepID=UPI00368F02F4
MRRTTGTVVAFAAATTMTAGTATLAHAADEQPAPSKITTKIINYSPTEQLLLIDASTAHDAPFVGSKPVAGLTSIGPGTALTYNNVPSPDMRTTTVWETGDGVTVRYTRATSAVDTGTCTVAGAGWSDYVCQVATTAPGMQTVKIVPR